MQKKERIFRAVYKEATGSITNLFYVKDFEDEIEIDEDFDEEDQQRFIDDDILDEDNVRKSPAIQPFKGHFIFVENAIS